MFGRGQRVGRGGVVGGGYLSGFISVFGVVEYIAFGLNGILYHKKSQGHIDKDLEKSRDD